MVSRAGATLPRVFFEQVARLGDRVALRRKRAGLWERISWREYGERVREAAHGLLALGLRPGERVAILGENRPEWLYCHLGTMAAGGATVGLYPTSAPDQIAYLLDHAEVRVLFAENEEQLDKALEIWDKVGLERVVVWDPKGLWGFRHPRVVFLEEFSEAGRAHRERGPGALPARLAALRPKDTAMVIYTSGTTGPPKGAMLSHANVLFVAEALGAITGASEADEVVSYLPLAHIYENLLSVFQAVQAGYRVNFVESRETLFQNVREVSPTVFASVPRIWEKLASGVELRMADSTLLKRALYRLAVAVGRRAARLEVEARTLPLAVRALRALLDLVALRPLRHQLGFDRARLAISGAAPASPELFDYYRGLGVPLLEGYGQTESSGVIAVQRPGGIRRGTVGPPIDGIEVRIAEDGEILVRGPNVFQGYLKDPGLTAATLADGWLRTGDVGALDEAGHLRILDRKKDIVITAGGKNVAPACIENTLKWSPYIQDAVVIGDRRPHLVALILLDEDNVARYAQERGIAFTTFADLAQNPLVRRLIAQEVDRVNRALSSAEAIRRFALLPRRLYEEEGDVTPTQKVKRRSVEERYADLIADLYRD